MMIVLLYPISIIKILFSRQFYFTFVEATLLFALLLIALSTLTDSTYRIFVFCISLLYFIPFILYVIDIDKQKRQRVKEKRGTGGYLRWDGVYEIHIGDVKSAREFQEKMIRAFLYCRDRELKVEFIAANRTKEKLLRDYGSAIIGIKALNFYSKIIIRFTSNKKTVVRASKYPLKVLLDPSKLSIELLGSGQYVLKQNKKTEENRNS